MIWRVGYGFKVQGVGKELNSKLAPETLRSLLQEFTQQISGLSSTPRSALSGLLAAIGVYITAAARLGSYIPDLVGLLHAHGAWEVQPILKG